jgi:hypothetical protein
MSGQLVIAELQAFQAVLGKVKRSDGETVRVWCRSTIPNALHRVGPTDLMKTAAEEAWAAADHLAQTLDETDGNIEPARERAMEAVESLVAAVRLIKAAGPAEVQ